MPASESKPTVLVTGAAGALARHVVQRLSRQWRVVAIDFRRPFDLPQVLAGYTVPPERRRLEAVFRKHRFDALVHLGRMFAHEQTPQQRYAANLLGTQRLLDLARSHGVGRVVVHSSYFVYGALEDRPGPLPVDTPLLAARFSPDLVDAVEQEHLIARYRHQYPALDLTVLRPCNVLGPGVRNSLSLLLGRPLAPVIFGYAPALQILHVTDMAEALVTALEQNRPGVYNVAGADAVAWPEIVRRCGARPVPIPPVASADLSGRLGRWLGIPRWLPPYLIDFLKYPVLIDGGPFQQTFGWDPRHRADQVLAELRRARH